MLGWCTNSSTSLLSELPEEVDLIDHIQEPIAEQRLTWDGRKGQWIPVSYSFTFPKDGFDHVVDFDGHIGARVTTGYSFPPSKRHCVMLDQGSPCLRIIPKASLNGRRPCLLRSIPKSPLAGRVIKAEEHETEDEETPYDPIDPFNLDHRAVKPMTWLDDIDIEEFLSSAIDYQTDNHLSQTPMSEPIFPLFSKRRRSSPCTPSSPPPPLFLDDNIPIPDFRPSPTRS